MKAKIALYKNVKYQSEPAPVQVGDWIENSKEYIRLSEVVEVDFPDLEKTEVIKKEVESIENQIESIKNEAMVKVSRLQEKKAELLALTHIQSGTIRGVS